eukprot:2867382-Lingulodinium_polyedra.AAC.1
MVTEERPPHGPSTAGSSAAFQPALRSHHAASVQRWAASFISCTATASTPVKSLSHSCAVP